ncbi:protein jag [Tropheryma whipplei]|uniref:Jag family protein n=1 Tax=Tropheryma whipplei TaxID=2039 RepID=UPI0004B234C9|nr:R3H domain-containing nucleic acid-binding protein [Tropheryma whipplei]
MTEGLTNGLDSELNMGSDADRVANLAADYLEGFLDICDLDGDIKVSLSEDRISISVNDDTDALAPLSDPVVVKALRDLMALHVRTRAQHACKVALSIGRSSQIKEEALRNMVLAGIAKIKAGVWAVHMPHMCSYDRRIVHRIAADMGCASESQGVGPSRHVVLSNP